jgi:hypothetical protein
MEGTGVVSDIPIEFGAEALGTRWHYGIFLGDSNLPSSDDLFDSLNNVMKLGFLLPFFLCCNISN